MNCQKCNIINSNSASFCSGCGAKLKIKSKENVSKKTSGQKPQFSMNKILEKIMPKKTSDKNPKSLMKKVLLVLGLLILAGAIIWGISYASEKKRFNDFVKYMEDSQNQTGTETVPTNPPPSTNTSTPDNNTSTEIDTGSGSDTDNSAQSTKLEDLPVYPNSSITDTLDVDGGGKRVAYEPQLGVASKEIMDFYEKELTSKGWQVVTRDRDDAQLDILSMDGTFVRIWIYFEGIDEAGSDPLPATFMLDFQPPGAKILPIPYQ